MLVVVAAVSLVVAPLGGLVQLLLRDVLLHEAAVVGQRDGAHLVQHGVVAGLAGDVLVARVSHRASVATYED